MAGEEQNVSMPAGTDRRVVALHSNMHTAGVAPEVISEVMAGGEAIRSKTSNKAKAAWFHDAMERMDRLVEAETRQAVREACACCLGGKRLKLSKAIARDHDTLEARVAAANETPAVFGYSVTQQEDGSIVVAFDADKPSYRCVCLSKAEEPISITYCLCCGGHIKHHLQIALGRTLHMEAVTSALASDGADPCTFRFTLLD